MKQAQLQGDIPPTHTDRLPHAKLPYTSRYEIRVDVLTLRQIGYRDPEGGYHELRHGEELVLTRNSAGMRDPHIRTSTGALKALAVPGRQADPVQAIRSNLNDIIARCSVKGKLFGRDVTLTEDDRVVLGVVVDAAQRILDDAVAADPRYERLEEALRIQHKEVCLFGITSRILDKGPNAEVHRYEKGGLYYIDVPTNVHRLYHWLAIVDSIRDYQITSAEELRGRSAGHLAKDLKRLAGLFPKTPKEAATK